MAERTCVRPGGRNLVWPEAVGRRVKLQRARLYSATCFAGAIGFTVLMAAGIEPGAAADAVAAAQTEPPRVLAGMPMSATLPLGVLLVLLAFSSVLLSPIGKAQVPALVNRQIQISLPLEKPATDIVVTPAITQRALPSEDIAGLMSQLSHELRTPLNAIIGFSDIMQRELLGPIGSDRYQGYAGNIRQSGYSLLKAVEDTMMLTRLLADRDTARAERIEIADVVSAAISIVEREARIRQIRLTSSLDGDHVAAARSEPLRQAIVCLLEAGIAEAAHGAAIAISCQHRADTVVIDIATRDVGIEDSATAGAAASHSLARSIGTTLVALQGGRVAHHGGLTTLTLPVWTAHA